jgi:hypothetical protein
LPFSVHRSGNGFLHLRFRLDEAATAAFRSVLERLAVRRAA